jgi:hypothetical protein
MTHFELPISQIMASRAQGGWLFSGMGNARRWVAITSQYKAARCI